MGTLGLLANGIKLGGPTSIAALADTLAKGANGLTLADVVLTFGSGTTLSNGALYANQLYRASTVITAGSNLDLDLYGSLLNPFGETINFATLRAILIGVASADGSAALRVGPQNVTHAFQGPWGGGGATVYETVYWQQLWLSGQAGWTVTDGALDVLRINNPGASSVTAQILLIGTQT